MTGGWAPETLHPSHLAALAPSVTPDVLLAIAGHRRFVRRLSVLLTPDLVDHAPPVPSSRAETLAFMSADRIEAAGRMMGAAWHGRSIGRCIGSELVGVLDAGIGREARLFGLRGAAHAIAPPQTLPAPDLINLVRADGLRCLVRWRDALAPPFRSLAGLKLARGALPASAPADADPIIAKVLERVLDAS